MDLIRKKLAHEPVWARAAPFLIFAILTYGQGKFGEASRYWFYLIKTVMGAWLVIAVWPIVTEMRWKCSLEAVLAGVGVFVLWVALDDWYPKLDQLLRSSVWPVFKWIGLESSAPQPAKTGLAWNPHTQFGQDSGVAWLFVVVRIVGSAVVVPPLEEVFYRSFLYRYLVQSEFLSVPLGAFIRGPFLFSGLIFGLAHSEWLAAILCALIFQYLVIRRQRLGDAMTAHAITNGLLGCWVAWRGDWRFW